MRWIKPLWNNMGIIILLFGLGYGIGLIINDFKFMNMKLVLVSLTLLGSKKTFDRFKEKNKK